MSLNKILSLAASIIKSTILFSLIFFNSNILSEETSQYNPDDQGILSIMYHRFDENKYPSTNIRMNIFLEHISAIKNNGFEFYNPELFDEEFDKPKDIKKILLTVDDAFLSFYENAWPVLKKEKIPFILFVSTEPIGKRGYMTWDQIKEIEKEKFAFIGNHSHTHEYLIDFSFADFKDDINKSIKIFEENLGYNPIFFSYPFGEYSLEQKNFIKKKFNYAFGQHSGVIDSTKDKYELPRFPINENYGKMERFNSIIKYFPLQYESFEPEDKYVLAINNPPSVKIKFFNNQKNIKNINCFSNEGDNWGNPNISVDENNVMKIFFREKFNFRRGRLNCSLNENGKWKWFGHQFTVQIPK